MLLVRSILRGATASTILLLNKHANYPHQPLTCGLSRST